MQRSERLEIMMSAGSARWLAAITQEYLRGPERNRLPAEIRN
jgi:hypothetical protein